MISRYLMGIMFGLIAGIVSPALAEMSRIDSPHLELSVHYHGYNPEQRARDLKQLKQIVKTFAASSVSRCWLERD